MICLFFYDSYLAKLPGWMLSPRQRLSPMPKDLLGALEFIFRASNSLSRIHFNLLMDPKPSFSIDPTFVENSRVIKLWNQ